MASLFQEDQLTIPYIIGDGIGSDITPTTINLIDEAVKFAFAGAKKINWLKVDAGESAYATCGNYLPTVTLDTIKKHKVCLKGPLATPTGGGIRSLNVAIRQQLDLYACVRPVKYINGSPSPLVHPEYTDMVIFRENSEDIYAGIEWEAGSNEANKLIKTLTEDYAVSNIRFPTNCAIGIKPVSLLGSKRLIRMAINYAIINKRQSVTLVHKGNIMKFTEGAFASWGYELACQEFNGKTNADGTVTISLPHAEHDLIIKDVIADSFFQQILLRPREYDVIATLNLNGDYISDALAAQVGGIGMAPGANIGDDCAVFEATHGTAPKYTGLDKVNPSSLILSGAMLCDHIGWDNAATAIRNGVMRAILNKNLTYDLARQIDGAREIKCSEFAQNIINNFNI